MSLQPPAPQEKDHRFLDETGDTTFFGKGGVPILGQDGVSRCFSLGMARFKTPVGAARREVEALCRDVEADSYLNRIPSVAKRIESGGFFFHAKDDPPEVRERLYKWILATDCSFEMVVGRKIPALFAKKHNGKEAEFYADLLSHLLKTKLKLDKKLVMNIAERGTTTRNQVLESALSKAHERFAKKGETAEISSVVVFNVQTPRSEPLLCVPDYLGWAVQRVLERGDTRHYDYARERISMVLDLYDQANYIGSKHYYTPRRPLTAANKIGPQTS